MDASEVFTTSARDQRAAYAERLTGACELAEGLGAARSMVPIRRIGEVRRYVIDGRRPYGVAVRQTNVGRSTPECPETLDLQ